MTAITANQPRKTLDDLKAEARQEEQERQRSAYDYTTRILVQQEEAKALLHKRVVTWLEDQTGVSLARYLTWVKWDGTMRVTLSVPQHREIDSYIHEYQGAFRFEQPGNPWRVHLDWYRTLGDALVAAEIR
jgi:hypothetical protein